MKKNFFRDYKRFLNLLGSHRRQYIFLVVLAAISWSVSVILQSYAIKVIIEFFVYNDSSYLTLAIIIVGLRLIVDGFINPLTMNVVQKRQELIMRDIRKSVFRHMQSLPVSYYADKHSGDLLVRVNTDVDSLKEAMDSIHASFTFIIAFIMVIPYFAILDYRLLVIALCMGLSFMIVTLKILDPIRKTVGKMREHISSVAKTASESVSGFQIVRMFGLEKLFKKRITSNLDDLYVEQRKYSKLTGLNYGTGIFIWMAGSTVIASLGAWFAINQSLEIGNLVATISVTTSMIFTIIDLGQLPVRLQKSFAGTDRLFELFEKESERISYSEISGTGTDSAISFKDVNFSYEPEYKVLDGLSFDVPKGKTVAFVGDSGGGKSTAVKLILGLHCPDEGKITIQNRAMGNYKLEELREVLAYVPQNAYIFNGTIYENIYYGNPDATAEEIEEAAKKANAHDFIMSKKDDYQTIVGERGIKLSGGERQRIAIARAIVKNAPLLIFDEATSSLDKESELLVQSALDNLLEDRSSIVIAHRLSTVKKADCIYFIKRGSVAEHGSHDELIAKCGLYHELYYKTFINE